MDLDFMGFCMMRSLASCAGTAALLFALTGSVLAADVSDGPARAAPSGIFCSCPPTLARGSRSVLPSLVEKSFVSGFLVRVEWRELEPQPGQYQWSLLDEQLGTALHYGKKVALAVMNGPAAPGWLAQSGAAMFRFPFRGRTAQMPVPWDVVYLTQWTRFIDALGRRYRDHPAIALVHVTHSTFNGFEMQLPAMPPDRTQWQQLGYRSEKVANSWMTVVSAFARAFPRHPIDVDVHPVIVSETDQGSEVARAAVSFGRQFAGNRFGVFAGWWSADNAQRVYPDMYSLLRESARASFAAVQMVASARQNPERIGGGMHESIDLAFAQGIRYVEIWESDLLDPPQTPYWESLAKRLEGKH